MFPLLPVLGLPPEEAKCQFGLVGDGIDMGTPDFMLSWMPTPKFVVVLAFSEGMSQAEG